MSHSDYCLTQVNIRMFCLWMHSITHHMAKLGVTVEVMIGKCIAGLEGMIGKSGKPYFNHLDWMGSKHNFEHCCNWTTLILCLWDSSAARAFFIHLLFSQSPAETGCLSLKTSVGTYSINVQCTPPTVTLCGNACTTHSLEPGRGLCHEN